GGAPRSLHPPPTRRSSDLVAFSWQSARRTSAGGGGLAGRAAVRPRLAGRAAGGPLGAFARGPPALGGYSGGASQRRGRPFQVVRDRKSTRLNSSHQITSYA